MATIRRWGVRPLRVNLAAAYHLRAQVLKTGEVRRFAPSISSVNLSEATRSLSYGTYAIIRIGEVFWSVRVEPNIARLGGYCEIAHLRAGQAVAYRTLDHAIVATVMSLGGEDA